MSLFNLITIIPLKTGTFRAAVSPVYNNIIWRGAYFLCAHLRCSNV